MVMHWWRTGLEAQAAKQPEATVGSRKPPEFIELKWSLIYKCFTKQKRGGLLTLEWILDWTFKGTLWERGAAHPVCLRQTWL